MKLIQSLIVTACVFTLSARGESNVKISEVHLCCKSCITGVEKAVGTVDGAKAEVDQAAGTVTITGPDTATVQKGATALLKAGYFGKSSDPAIKMNSRTGAKGTQVKNLKVEGVHLCCGKCVKAVDHAMKTVSGVKEHTATKGAESFDVTGDFSDKEVFTALQKEGLTGKVGK